MNSRTVLGAIPAIFVVALGVGRVAAYEALQCNGEIYRGLHSNVTFAVDRCDTPAGSAEQTVIDEAMHDWNDLYGMSDRFSSTGGDSNCSVGPGSNGVWDIGLVPASDAVLDGNAGVASKFGPTDCTNNGALSGASVVIDQTLPLGFLEELDTRLGARETLIHELGHVLGADHEDDVMAVMCTSNTCGKVGRRSGATTSSLGRHPETIWGDETLFAVRYHGTSNSGNVDPTVSPWQFTSSGISLNYNGTNRQKCPGQTTSVKFSLANLGKKNIESSNHADVHIVFSNDDYISTGDVLAATGTSWMDSGYFGTTSWTVTVPSLSPGTYHVGVIIDPGDEFTEDDEFNNATETGLRVTVPSGC